MEYTLKFTQQEIQILSLALGELPLKVTLSLFSKIQEAAAKQDAEKAIPLESLGSGGMNDPDIEYALTGKP